jgi:hypothetical protein
MVNKKRLLTSGPQKIAQAAPVIRPKLGPEWRSTAREGGKPPKILRLASERGQREGAPPIRKAQSWLCFARRRFEPARKEDTIFDDRCRDAIAGFRRLNHSDACIGGIT